MRTALLLAVLLPAVALAQVPPWMKAGGSVGGGSGTVTGVSGTAPIVSDGNTTNPTLSCTMATTGTAGCVSAASQSFSGSKTFLAIGHFSAAFDASGGTVTITETGTTTGLLINASTAASGTGPLIVKMLLTGDVAAGISLDATANASGKIWSMLSLATGNFGIFNGTSYFFNCLSGGGCAVGGGAQTIVSPSWGLSIGASFRLTDSVGTADYFNVTSAGASIGAGTRVSKWLRGTTTNPSAVTAGTCADTTITTTGAAVNAECSYSQPATGLQFGLHADCRVSAADTVKLRICNYTAGDLTPTAGTYTVRVTDP